MKFTKCHAAVISLGCDPEPRKECGYKFNFPDYPTVSFFVHKNPANKLWFVRELRTGLKVGTDDAAARTRRKAVANQHFVLTHPRDCPRGKHKRSYVISRIDAFIANWVANGGRINYEPTTDK